MAATEGRTLRVRAPWPTGRQAAERIIRLVAFLASLQFFMNAFAVFLPPLGLFIAWAGCGTLVLWSTLRIEKYLARKRGLAP